MTVDFSLETVQPGTQWSHMFKVKVVCLYIFEVNPLSVSSFAIIFSHSEGCLFTLLIVSFVVQKLLSLIRSHLFIFAFISNKIGSCCDLCQRVFLQVGSLPSEPPGKPQRNYMGWKITVCMCSWGKFWTKNMKRPKNPTAVFEDPGT